MNEYRSRLVRFTCALVIGIAPLTWVHGSHAQRSRQAGGFTVHVPQVQRMPRPRLPGHHASAGGDAGAARSSDARLLFARADALLESSEQQDRLRGIRLLGAARDYQAALVLVAHYEKRRRDRSVSPMEQRETAWALAPFAGRRMVGHLLESWIVAPRARRGVTAVKDMALETCALALASSGNPTAIERLVAMLKRDGARSEDISDRARRALLAHPPVVLSQLVAKDALESLAVLRLLGDLGDVRAIGPLRGVLSEGGVRHQSAAAVALAKLGDGSVAPVVRKWLRQPGSVIAQRVSAARALALLRDSVAPKAIAILLADPASRKQGIALALANPTPQLVPTLAGLVPVDLGQARHDLLLALARAGHALAARTLLKAYRANPHDDDLAFAIAHFRGDAGDYVLNKLLGDDQLSREAVRLSVVRWLRTGRKPSKLDDTITHLLSSKALGDQQTARWARQLLRRDDATTATFTAPTDLAVCTSSLLMPTPLRSTCQRLATPRASEEQLGAACLSLTFSERGPNVTDKQLFSWAEAANLRASCFARFVGTRDSDRNRERIVRLLDSADPVMRAQVAIGLAASKRKSVVSLLRSRFERERLSMVRAAIVRGLSTHMSKSVKGWLQQVASLDPDPTVRALAHAAATGQRLDHFQPGAHVVWAKVNVRGSKQVRIVARVVTPSGWTFVVPVTSDGVLVLAGLPTDSVHVTLRQDAQGQQTHRAEHKNQDPARQVR